MIAILIILVKLANSRPPWNNYFLKKRLTYHNFCPRHHQTKVIYLSQIILHMWSCDKTSVILVFLWFYKDLTKERDFFQGWFWFNLTKLGLVLGMIYWKLERFLRGGGELKLPPVLNSLGFMLETWNLVRKYTHIHSSKKYTSKYQGHFNFADLSIFCKERALFWQEYYRPRVGIRVPDSSRLAIKRRINNDVTI